jgi:RNA polymerase sigma factor (sigma-70 family)
MQYERAGTNVTSAFMTSTPSHPLATDTALRRRLTALARRWMGQGNEAEDMVQEAYLRTALGGLPGSEAGQQAWLTTVVHHLCIDAVRRQARYQAVLAEVAGDTREASPEHLSEQDQQVLNALMSLVQRLAPEDVAAVLLYEVFELGHAELGDISGRSEAASRQHMHRLLRRLKFDIHESDRQGGTRLDAEHHALLSLCRLAMVQRDASGLMALLQAARPMALSAAGGCQPEAPAAKAEEGGTSTRLILVQGRLAMAVCLGGVLLCVLPVGCNPVAEHA